MQFIIDGTPNEIKNALLAINESKECNTKINVSMSSGRIGDNFSIMANKLYHVIEKSTHDTTMLIKVRE